MQVSACMDRSKLSNVIATTRLLPFFSTQNVSQMKSCIFEQLGCENESQFLCKVLQSLYKNMSVESTAIIKNKAIEIADLQSMTPTQNLNDIITKPRNNAKCSDNHITVYKYIQQQHHDLLSKLHSDIIDYLGTFLNKKQSIEFGYLNKQLYIETQKHSYLLKRCKDDGLILGDQKMSRLLQSQSNSFNYSFPTELTLRWCKKYQVSKLSDFDLFFRRLNTLQCYTLTCLSHIPCHALFNHNTNRDDKLQKLTLTLNFIGIPDGQIDAIKKFCARFDEYKDSIDNNSKIRYIKQFELDGGRYWMIRKDEMKTAAQQATKQLLMRVCNISESICLSVGLFAINTTEELQTIFHKNLKHLYLSQTSAIQANKSMIDYSTMNTKKNIQDIAKMESFGIHLDDGASTVGTINECTINTLAFLDKFSMRKGIKSYTIHWKCSSSINYFHNTFVTNEFGNKLDILDRIFFKDFHKHPLLEKITIKFKDEYDLRIFARLLIYFNQHYTQLFVERKLYLKHFKSIEIELNGIINHYFGDSVICDYKHIFQAVHNDAESIFLQKSDKDYPINQKTIEIENIKQGIESFGVMFKNVFNWLKSRQGQSSGDEISGCKIVLLIP